MGRMDLKKKIKDIFVWKVKLFLNARVYKIKKIVLKIICEKLQNCPFKKNEKIYRIIQNKR